MSGVAIEFVELSKHFDSWVDRPNSIKTVLADLLRFKFEGGNRRRHEVLDKINLEINTGDFVGIMGRNGVGKSTLLKLISGIYQPSSGRVKTYGRIAPLLELGAGFASELTGYENIFLNASILGFSRKEIQSKLNLIMEFSELREFLHQPVRNYSSGMLVRLGFSIAAHLDAEILLFDEILAVGDVGFQSKSLAKIKELHREGRTVVLVTHSPEQVRASCSRCLVINKTGVLYDGAPAAGTEAYEHLFQT